MARKNSAGENVNLWVILLAVVVAAAALAAFFMRGRGEDLPADLPVEESSASSELPEESSGTEEEPSSEEESEASRPVIGGGDTSQPVQVKSDKLNITESGEYTRRRPSARW